MSLKILAFGASNSKNSINRKLAKFVSGLFLDTKVTLLDLNDFEMPLFSVDRETNFPAPATRFAKLIDETDLIVLSLAENNGNFSAAFKNIFDWVSRIPKRKVFNNKKLLLLATSPGARGGGTVLDIALKRFPFDSAVIVGSMSLPSFNENFNETTGITHPEHLAKAKELVKIASQL